MSKASRSEPQFPMADGRWPVRGSLDVLGQQRDITYYDSFAASVLNDTRMTGMAYWSVNPYTGCAFGCAYCYARPTHEYLGFGAGADFDDGVARIRRVGR